MDLTFDNNVALSENVIHSTGMKDDNVELIFEDKAIEAIAKEAIKRKTGARALRSIVEEIMLDVMYEVPSRTDIEKFTITADMVVKNNVVTINKKTKSEKSKGAPKEEIA